MEQRTSEYRTSWCGHISEKNLSQTVMLSGWVDRRRDHGGLIFVDLRDRTGICQLVFNTVFNSESFKLAHELRAEYVISVTGILVERTPATVNADLPTGKFELQVHELRILNRTKTLPFSLETADSVDEELRLTYRYLDLRRPSHHEKLAWRHKIIFLMRQFLHERGFYEIETPILTKSTAEGAREFIVPSRVHKGAFYALPQSPQLYKQLLMAGGMERYFQIARCFRDEDLRADRQPEFTQLDIEMSFISEKDIQNLIEELLQKIFALFQIPIQLPLQRMTYDEAFSLYGSDKPDVRFELKIHDATELFFDSQLSFIKSVLEKNGKIGALCVRQREFTRSELEKWVAQALSNGAKGLVWIKITADGFEAPISKYLPADFQERAQKIFGELKAGDTIFLVASQYKEAWIQLGRLRLQLAADLGLFVKNDVKLLWITDFPLLEYSAEEKRWTSVHHPFTRPQDGWEFLPPENIKARSYDVVFNGVELGGGSIRIHESELQQKIFNFLGFDAEAMDLQFGFLLEAQQLGFPPHGGIALGIDRLIMLLLHCQSIREVIAFPKTATGMDPLLQAPADISNKETKLRELGLAELADEHQR